MSRVRRDWMCAGVALWIMLNALAAGAWVCASLGGGWELWGLMGLGGTVVLAGIVAAGKAQEALAEQRAIDEAEMRAKRRWGRARDAAWAMREGRTVSNQMESVRGREDA
jgi:hypothetical protein